MRTLKVHLLLALLSGVIVFAVLNLAAWYNHRGEMNVCRRQSHTRIKLRFAADEIRDYQTKHEVLPKHLSDIPKMSDEMLTDAWGNPIQFSVSGEEFAVFSFGRNGKPGGMGLDADLFHDERNREQSLPTLRQFFLTNDPAEVDRGGFIIAGLLAGGLIAFTVFRSFQDLEKKKKQLSPGELLVSLVVMLVLACVIGIFLLPLHIPSGH